MRASSPIEKERPVSQPGDSYYPSNLLFFLVHWLSLELKPLVVQNEL